MLFTFDNFFLSNIFQKTILFDFVLSFIVQVAKAVSAHLEIDPMMLQFFKGQA